MWWVGVWDERPAVKKRAELVAWIIKYFTDDSVDGVFFSEERRAMNDIVLSSNPVHKNSQWEVDIVIMVPRMRVDKNSMWCGRYIRTRKLLISLSLVRSQAFCKGCSIEFS